MVVRWTRIFLVSAITSLAGGVAGGSSSVESGEATGRQCEDTSDSSSYLQNQLKASTHLALSGNLSVDQASGLCATGDTINTGVCNSNSAQPNQCTDCRFSPATEVPTNADRFPTGSLLCENDGGDEVCQGGRASYEFKDPNDYLTCRGHRACVADFFAQDMGAVCCSVEDARGQACFSVARFTLSAAGTCTPDMCCDGYQTCVGRDGRGDSGINSLSCRGPSGCGDGLSSIAKHLYCNNASLVSESTEIAGACSASTFNFQPASEHCVACLGQGSCTMSTFAFRRNVAGTIFQQCVGLGACESVTVTVPDDSSLSLSCRGQGACAAGSVTMLERSGTAGTLYLECDGSNACNNMNIVLENNAACQCQNSTGGICPAVCTEPATFSPPAIPASCTTTDGITMTDTACCAGDSSVDGGHPQCRNCGCTAPTTTTSTAGGGGDPHIDTFDGQHYTLLKQGTFSFWRFSGVQAEEPAKDSIKKFPVDFKIYTHYSGRRSFIKGLLLVDLSGECHHPRQVMEMTSKDCKWRGKVDDLPWSSMEPQQLLSLKDDLGHEMTAFRMKGESSKGHVELLMKKHGSFKKIAELYVRCRRGHQLNIKMAMASKEDIRLVQGELGLHHRDHGKISFLQGQSMSMRSDREFSVAKKWKNLGGSEAAATYLSLVDEEGPQASLMECSREQRIEAEAVCKKHLGEHAKNKQDLQSFEQRLQFCIVDVCNGGGEATAELAEEIFTAD